MSLLWIRVLFFVAAVYDFLIGLAFLVAGDQVFERFSIPAPAHWGYIHFCCLMLMIFGLMFLKIALRPHANRDLIPFGMLLKISYVGVSGYYWLNGGIPWLFKPFLFVDVLMLIGFGWAWFSLLTKDPKS